MNILLIVDPQIDFISGALPVPDAAKAMDYVTAWTKEHEEDYDMIVVTLDLHPADHCSFTTQGGMWPVHCVRFTVGAALYPPLGEVLMDLKRRGHNVLFIPKAMTRQKEAYSAFQDAVPDPLMHAMRIDIAGLAGDYCVQSTIHDLRRQLSTTQLRTIDQGIAWIGEPYPLL